MTEKDLCKIFIKRVNFYQGWKYYHRPFKIIHAANEQRSSGNRRKDIMYTNSLISIGMLPGAPDYLILYEAGWAAIEFKKDKYGKLSPNQVKFKEFCLSVNVPYLLTYKVDEALEFLASLINAK